MDIRSDNNSAYAKACNSNTVRVSSERERGDTPAVSQGAEDTALKSEISKAPDLRNNREILLRELFEKLREANSKNHDDIVSRFINDIPEPAEKDAICLSIVKNKDMDGEVRYFAIYNIQSLKIRDEAYVFIAQDKTTDFLYRKCAASDIQDEALKDEACASVVLDTTIPKDIYPLVDAITNPDVRDKACFDKLPNLKYVSTQINLAQRIANNNLRDTALVEIVKNPKATIEDCLKVVQGIKDDKLRNTALAEIVKNPKATLKDCLGVTQRITDDNLRDTALAEFAKNTNNQLTFKDIKGLAQAIKTDAIRDDVLTFILDNKNLFLRNRMEIIGLISNDDKRDECYTRVVQYKSGHGPLVVRTQLDAFSKIISSKVVQDLLSTIRPDHDLYGQFLFYEVLIRHGFIDVVQNTMNTNIEGLDPAEMEAVRRKKVAAAEAIFDINQDDMDAAYILTSMSENAENSPVVLYQTIQAKAKEPVSLEEILEAKKDSVASRLENGKKVYFNSRAFLLPRAMNPKWEEAFEDINFTSFMEQIKLVFRGYGQDLTARLDKARGENTLEALQTEIQGNQALEKEYLSYFHSGERITLQQALNNRKQENVLGNKMKAIAKGIQECIDKKNFFEGLGILSELKVNMETCKGGDQQAIEMTYMNKMLSQDLKRSQEEKSSDNAEVNLLMAREKVANLLYLIISNWILEGKIIERNGLPCVAYSPGKLGESFVEKILKRCPEAADFLKGNAFENTHYGLAIMGMAGKELGLRDPESNPTFDPNCEAAQKLIQCKELTKALLLEAFTDAFTFENLHKIMGELLFETLAAELPASESKLKGGELFEDEACTQKLDINICSQLLSPGPQAFLKNIGFDEAEINNFFTTKTCYYQDPVFGDIDSTHLNVSFSKEGLAENFLKLGLLSVIEESE